MRLRSVSPPIDPDSGVFTPLIEYEIARLERLIDGPTATGRGSSGMLEALIHLFGYISSYHNARLVVGSNLPRSTTTPQGEGGLSLNGTILAQGDTTSWYAMLSPVPDLLQDHRPLDSCLINVPVQNERI